jgi:hypothetical protein
MKQLIKETVFIVFILVLLTGCTFDPQLREISLKLEEDQKMVFMICWPEDSPYGRQLRRIVNNYNLSLSEEQRVSIIFFANEETYMKKLRGMIATSTLPDFFILLDNPAEAFIKKSTKIMDLKGFENMFGVAAEGGLRYGGRLIGIDLDQTSMDLLVNRNAYDSLTQTSHISNMDLLMKLAVNNKSVENWATDFILDEWIFSTSGADYLEMLYQYQRKETKIDTLKMALIRWKQTLHLFGNILVLNENDVKKNSVLKIYSSSYQSLHDKNYALISTLAQPSISFVGYRYYVAAAKTSSKSREANVIRFLKYFASLIHTMNWYENETDSTVLTLRTHCLSPEDKESLNIALKLYSKNIIDTDECVERIEQLLSRGE